MARKRKPVISDKTMGDAYPEIWKASDDVDNEICRMIDELAAYAGQHNLPFVIAVETANKMSSKKTNEMVSRVRGAGHISHHSRQVHPELIKMLLIYKQQHDIAKSEWKTDFPSANVQSTKKHDEDISKK